MNQPALPLRSRPLHSSLRHSSRSQPFPWQVSPWQSLDEGHWFKLISGASFQHLPSVRSLALVYSLAGADCIDVAADPAVIAIAQDGLRAAQTLKASQSGSAWPQPLLMASINDGEDPHFRKASFDPSHCPDDCPRPCVTICPAQAILRSESSDSASEAIPSTWGGVVESRCYGCGRCIPICPIQAIEARTHVHHPQTILPTLIEAGIDALEIHTQVGHLAEFEHLWQALLPWLSRLQLLAISCPDAEGVLDYLEALWARISPVWSGTLIWQTDGRPMSGDIGAGTTHTTIRYAERLLRSGLPGYVQLAGGTNHYTVTKLESLGLLRWRQPAPSDPIASRLSPSTLLQRDSPALDYPRAVAGVAYGSYGRTLLDPVLQGLDQRLASHLEQTGEGLEDHPDLLQTAIAQAVSLVHPLKPPHRRVVWDLGSQGIEPAF